MFKIYILAFILSAEVFGTELCKKTEFFNDISGKCQTCRVCPGKSWEMAPCLEFSDTMCVDLAEIGRSIELNRRWHETEGPEEGNEVMFIKTKISDSGSEDFGGMWTRATLGVLLLTTFTIVVIIITVLWRVCGKPNRNENRKALRRLFSRERLNTTEYMNNLATLDRRLAIDEILEKRKKAIFEPQLLKENVYVDEVFVDISGLPRNTMHHEYEELDNRKCLLQMQERQ